MIFTTRAHSCDFFLNPQYLFGLVGTPMSIILGYAKIMENLVGDEKNRERARIISEQTQRVTNLITRPWP